MHNIRTCCFWCPNLSILYTRVLFSIGKMSVAIILYDPRRSNFFRIERESSVKFKHMLAPQPTDIATTAGLEVVEAINEISDRYIYSLPQAFYIFICFYEKNSHNKICNIIPIFTSAIEELLSTSSLSPVELLAKALLTKIQI